MAFDSFMSIDVSTRRAAYLAADCEVWHSEHFASSVFLKFFATSVFLKFLQPVYFTEICILRAQLRLVLTRCIFRRERGEGKYLVVICPNLELRYLCLKYQFN